MKRNVIFYQFVFPFLGIQSIKKSLDIWEKAARGKKSFSKWLLTKYKLADHIISINTLDSFSDRSNGIEDMKRGLFRIKKMHSSCNHTPVITGVGSNT